MRSRLTLLVLACVLPASLAAWLALVHAYRQEVKAQGAHALMVAQSTLQRADAELAATTAALQVLAASPALAAGDIAAFESQARRAMQGRRDEHLVLGTPDGQEVVDTRLGVGEARRPERRPFDGKGADVAVATPGVARSHPVVELPVLAPDGRALFSLRAAYAPGRLARLPTIAPESDWLVGVFDRGGAIVARSEGIERLFGRPGAPGLRAALGEHDEGIIEADSVDGAPMLVAFSRSAASGWAAAVGIPKRTLLAGLHRQMVWLVVGTALLFGAGMVMATTIAHRIAASIRGLVAPAMALGRGDTLPVPATHLREADAVAVALQAASHLLSARTQERDQAARANEKLAFAAQHDGLTALANRAAFLEQLEQRIEACRRVDGCLTVFFVDLDNFKPVNDLHGHAVGDALLQAFATRLRGAVREGDVAARLGGDEFAVLIDGLAPAAAEPIAQALLDRLSQVYALGEHRVSVSASIGLAGFPADGRDARSLLTAADHAMYKVKAAGKGDFRRSGWATL